jgi:hypothetical protein
MPVLEVYERSTTRTLVRDADEPAAPFACTPSDPFGIDDRCSNAGGHYPVASCDAVVCVHCSKVFWQ